MIMFQRVFKNYVELEVRKGVQGGGYTVAKAKIASLPKRELQGVLADMHQITEVVPEIPSSGKYYIPMKNRNVPVETQFVS